MASKTLQIATFPTGYYMSWYVTTQSSWSITVSLSDDTKTYFDETRESTDIDPPLAIGAATIEGSNLTLSINEPTSTNLRPFMNSYEILREDGSIAGYGYNIFFEDGDDLDYNDICVELVAWSHEG